MKSSLNPRLIFLAENCPYPLYIVGGRVRDFLAGLKTQKFDNDICAPADADDFVMRAKEAGFIVNAVYKNTGTVKLSEGGDDYEFTCFRSDEYVRGEHKPVKTFFTTDITLDAHRRDFKCNAVYYDICRGEFIDPLGGIEDIRRKRLTTVDRAEKVFGEDGLRLMRLARIAAQTGFKPDNECFEGAKNNANLIADISVERVYSELNAILHADLKYGVPLAQYEGLKLLKGIGVLKIILPELGDGEGMYQRGDIHKYDVLEHSLKTVAYADKSIRLCALLHDIGKPFCMKRDGNFYAHAEEGARIASGICARLRVPKRLSERVAKLIELHMYDLRCDARENKIRKFIVKNYAYFDDLMLLKQADYSACMDDTKSAPSVVKMRGILEKMQSEGLPLTVKELDVKGDELIAAGCPRERVGAILEKLLLDCAIKLVVNEKSKLIIYAQKLAFEN